MVSRKFEPGGEGEEVTVTYWKSKRNREGQTDGEKVTVRCKTERDVKEREEDRQTHTQTNSLKIKYVFLLFFIFEIIRFSASNTKYYIDYLTPSM